MSPMQPSYLEIMPVMWARAPRSRFDRQPPCDSPGCPLKRALFVLESYVDYDYLTPLLLAEDKTVELTTEVAHYLLAEYARWQGKPHLYSTVNICYNCLVARVDGHTQGKHGKTAVNWLRDSEGGSLLLYCRYFEEDSPGMLAFCHSPDIEACIRQVVQ